MTDFEKEEFWKALGRLYDSSVETRKSIEELHARTSDLLRVAELHQRELQAQEKRLDRIDVLLQWVVEAERKREKGGTL